MDFFPTMIFLLVFLPIVALFASMPYLTRRTISFGVSITEDNFHHLKLITMRKRYVLWSCCSGFLLTAVIWAITMSTDALDFGMMTLILALGLVAIHFAIYLIFHLKMKKLKTALSSNESFSRIVAIDTSFRSRKITYSAYWYILHAMIAALSFVFAISYYDQIPDTLTLQYDFKGNPTTIVSKSYQAVFMTNAIQFVLIVLFVCIHYVIVKSKQQIDSTQPEYSLQQNIMFRRRWSLFAILFGLLTVILLSVIQWAIILSFSYAVMGTVVISFITLMTIGIFITVFSTGQGGSRIKVSTKTTGQIPMDDDKYWKLGEFYFNKNDPSLFVEKRNGIGWTLNYARPVGWIVLLLPLTAVAVVLYISFVR